MNFLKAKKIIALCLGLTIFMHPLFAMGLINKETNRTITTPTVSELTRLNEETPSLPAKSERLSGKVKVASNAKLKINKSLLSSSKTVGIKKAKVFDCQSCKNTCIAATVICFAASIVLLCVPCGGACLALETGCLIGCNGGACGEDPHGGPAN